MSEVYETNIKQLIPDMLYFRYFNISKIVKYIIDDVNNKNKNQ